MFEPDARHTTATPTPAKVFESTIEDEFRSWTPVDPPVNVLFVRVTEDAFSTFTPTPLPVRTLPSNSIGGGSPGGSGEYPIPPFCRVGPGWAFRRGGG